jgi:serine/threonine protein kinase/tetratricopeptide (TPR) repeat protein
MQAATIARYRVGRLIGAGGMGEVYLAEDEVLQRKVALKLLPARFTQDQERVRRFQREARAASALNHPNILTIYEIGHADQVHYIATEYIEGETLREVMASRRLSIAEVLDIAMGVAGALGAAHDAGILHRDIKPENIMLRPDGYVKVLDFGLAKLTDDALKDSATGQVLGTLIYISPEQARGQQPDARSDLYSLGSVMYEMITGAPVVRGDNFLDIAIAIANERVQPPSTTTPNIPPELDRIVLKALEKDRDARYPSARQLLSDLRALRQQLEFENKLMALDPHHSTPSLDQRPTAPMSFPPSITSGSSGRVMKVNRVMRSARMTTAAALGIAALVILVAVAVVKDGIFADRIGTVAVLPFANVSHDPNVEYLSDGISDSVIDSLSQLPQLHVVARSTVFRFKAKNVDPLAVGRELNVRGIVTGELTMRGDRVVVRARLTDAKKGTQIWGEQYDRKVADVLALQQELAQEISTQLRSRLTGEEKKLLAKGTSEDSEAFQLYLKGRYFETKYNDEEAIRRGIDYFNQAIERDPTYALAYTGLGDAYYNLSNLHMPPREAMPRAREAAQRALALDDSLAAAHTAMAMALVWYDWNFKKGEEEFKRALALNPNDVDTHLHYGDFLVAMGRFDAGIAEKRRAEQLDPLSITPSWDVGRALYYAGRYDEAIEQAKRTQELDRNFPYVYYLQAQIACRRGHLDEALPLMQRALDLGGRNTLLVATWGYMNARAGHRDEALKAMDELRTKSSKYVLPLFLARIHAALGENDQAFDYLERVYADRSESIVWLKVDPSFDPLRRDPRFIALLKRVGTA